MSLTRKDLRRSQSQVANAAAFVDGAEPKSKTKRGRPSQPGEKREPVTLSLTPQETSDLDDIHGRLNYLNYGKGTKTNFNRSDIVRRMTTYLKGLTDEELTELFSDLDK